MIVHGHNGHNAQDQREGRARLREKQRLDARNAHLRRSLADHEARVRAKRERTPNGEGTSSELSARERLQALRQRIAARRNPTTATEEGDGGDRIACGQPRREQGPSVAGNAGNQCDGAEQVEVQGLREGVGEPTRDEPPRNSIAEYAIHLHPREEAEADGGTGQPATRTTSALAAAAAAAAWHGCEAPGAADVTRRLSAR